MHVLNHWRSTRKKYWGNITVHRFLLNIWFCTQRKDGIITISIWSYQRVYHHYNDTKSMVCSSHGEMDYFDIVATVLQGDTLESNIFLICIDYIPRTSIDLIKNGFILKKTRSRWYPTEIMIDADYADDLVHLTITHAQVKSQQHSLEQIDYWSNENLIFVRK